MSLPTLGPCELYCDPDLLECGQGSGVDMLPYAQAATMILYELSGHAFPGACSRTVRPCRSACGCSWVLPGLSQAAAQWFWQGSYWRDANAGGQCGCGCIDQVTLAGYPVRSIDQVTIDGDVVDPATYRLDRHRHLVRVHPDHWPACQNLAVLDSEPGAFAITYTWGAAPPALANLAAIELACWLFRQSPPSDACEIPANVTNIIRQGVTMQLQGKVEGAAASLSMVGSFLEAYNPGKRRRSSGAWSPDVRYPRPRGAS